MNKLTGKIYWVLGDINSLSGDYKTNVSVSIIRDAIIEEHIIKFDWEATQDFWAGTVNLQNSHGNKYSGIAEFNRDDSTKVAAELFENNKGFILKGEWIEDGDIYIWWASISKK